ncbi:hypothetical protein HY643_00635 [Candidatus Woesearchaeota archaeon]|nr:hypothetical protein [Candidatus Woesearchaeota archaeon]
MSYTLCPSDFFLEQLDELTEEAKKLIEEKFVLIKINPYMYKRIKGYKLFLFRIRFSDNRREKRVIYLVEQPFVKILCILDRDKEYHDLRKYLKKLGCL